MVYITGDTHGELARLTGRAVRGIKRGDTLVVLGDFGFLWDGSHAEKRTLKKLGRLRFNLLFLDGCHENFDLLREYETVDYHGGKARQISGKLHYLQKGQVYEIDGTRLFCFGGGESEEREAAFEGKHWWRAELPTEIEMREGIENLKNAGRQVDYILTHEAPGKLLRFIRQGTVETGWFQTFLDKVMESVEYKAWYFARYHQDLAISPKAGALYTRILPLE